MDERFRRYPIGIQNFEDLRNNGYVYVDKTELIYRLTNTNKVYFYGKTLFFKPSPTIREKSASIYTRSLFFRKERLVQRIGNGNSGKRMGCLSGATY